MSDIRVETAIKELGFVDLNLADVKRRLAKVRYHTVDVAADIALANGADPDSGPAGELRRIAARVCDGIASAIAECERCAALAREYVAGRHADEALPADIDAACRRMVGAIQHAHRELAQMEAAL